MHRFIGMPAAALVLSGLLTACGSGIPVPLPVAPTPTPSEAAVAAQPPPTEVVEALEGGGLCSHFGLDTVARFRGHYNADDGGHYHGWAGSAGETFWVQC